MGKGVEEPLASSPKFELTIFRTDSDSPGYILNHFRGRLTSLCRFQSQVQASNLGGPSRRGIAPTH